MITVTESAVEKLKEILAEEENPNLKLRIFVQGGGCSGFQYGFTLDDEIKDDDFDIESNGVSILVDSVSSSYLQGAIIDFKNDDFSSNFVIKNPNATSTCGCGSSFSA